MFLGLILIALVILPTLFSMVIAWFIAKRLSSSKNKRYAIAMAITAVANLALYSDQIYYAHQVKSLCDQYGVNSIDPKVYENKTVYFKAELSRPVETADHITQRKYMGYDAYTQELLFEYNHYSLRKTPTFLGKIYSPFGIDNRMHIKLQRCEWVSDFFRNSSAKFSLQPILTRN